MNHFDKKRNVVVRGLFSLSIYVLVVALRDEAVQDFSFYCATVVLGFVALICLFVGVASDGTALSVDLILFYSAYELLMITISIMGIISFHLALPYTIDNELFAVVLFIRVMLFVYFIAYALHRAAEKRERTTLCDIVAV